MMEKVVQALKANIPRLGWGKDGKYYLKLFDKEKQLIKVVSDAFQKRIKDLETKVQLEHLLIEALLAFPSSVAVGKEFVLYKLPPEIAERVLNSRVPETHYAKLGEALRLIAVKRQKDNRAFQKRVEQERKKREK